ncbi:RNA polymerase sigma factor [Niabella aurantiaca]|uniref:RNA polymerase sigma factor n=1 Tax=Niabella aurantiaca TaxID=379900 RepID=UPI0012FAD239|nr:RNA polymerase sigma-70 factor [Niabella aurantiaca]
MENNGNLYKLLSKGDETSFSRFFSKYKEKVYGFLLLFVKVPETAEEITIDVFLRIWQKRASLPEVIDMDAFLFTICKRKALDFLRKTSREKKVQQQIHESFERHQKNTAAASDAHAVLESRELAEMLFRSLSPQRKNILILSRIEGLSHKEISQRLNISQSTVKNTIVQAMKALEPLKDKLRIESCWLVFLLLFQKL